MLLRRYHEKEEKAKEVETKKKDFILEDLTVAELKDEAKKRELKGYSNLNKDELIELIAGD